MQVLDRRWFHNKRCLDIGCNEGVITLAVVQRFAPLSMLGVDIDEGLVKAACRYAASVAHNRKAMTHLCDIPPPVLRQHLAFQICLAFHMILSYLIALMHLPDSTIIVHSRT